CLSRLLEKGANGGSVGQISRDRQRLSAAQTRLGRRLLQGVQATAGEHDLVPLVQKSQSGRPADAGPRSGDYGGLVVGIHYADTRFPLWTAIYNRASF